MSDNSQLDHQQLIVNLEEEEEEIFERHRQEKKELNAKIAKLRFSVPKNDKKRKKEVSLQIEQLESGLRLEHEREIEKWKERLHLQQQQPQDEPYDLSINKRNVSNSICTRDDGSTNTIVKSITSTELQPNIRISKSQRRRENKEKKERERQERIKTGQMDISENTRLVEMKKIESLLESRNLSLCEIPSDGDCMYKAIEHQLRLTRNVDVTAEELRDLASDYIRKNKDDFIPFLLNDDNNVVTDKEFEIYCDKIVKTKTWGGHLELKALSNRLKVPIEIIQAEGNTVEIGFNEFGSNSPLILCYFRHAYRLGEHYNSVMPNGDVADEEEWLNTE